MPAIFDHYFGPETSVQKGGWKRATNREEKDPQQHTERENGWKDAAMDAFWDPVTSMLGQYERDHPGVIQRFQQDQAEVDERLVQQILRRQEHQRTRLIQEAERTGYIKNFQARRLIKRALRLHIQQQAAVKYEQYQARSRKLALENDRLQGTTNEILEIMNKGKPEEQMRGVAVALNELHEQFAKQVTHVPESKEHDPNSVNCKAGKEDMPDLIPTSAIFPNVDYAVCDRQSPTWRLDKTKFPYTDDIRGNPNMPSSGAPSGALLKRSNARLPESSPEEKGDIVGHGNQASDEGQQSLTRNEGAKTEVGESISLGGTRLDSESSVNGPNVEEDGGAILPRSFEFAAPFSASLEYHEASAGQPSGLAPGGRKDLIMPTACSGKHDGHDHGTQSSREPTSDPSLWSADQNACWDSTSVAQHLRGGDEPRSLHERKQEQLPDLAPASTSVARVLKDAETCGRCQSEEAEHKPPIPQPIPAASRPPETGHFCTAPTILARQNQLPPWNRPKELDGIQATTTYEAAPTIPAHTKSYDDGPRSSRKGCRSRARHRPYHEESGITSSSPLQQTNTTGQNSQNLEAANVTTSIRTTLPISHSSSLSNPVGASKLEKPSKGSPKDNSRIITEIRNIKQEIEMTKIIEFHIGAARKDNQLRSQIRSIREQARGTNSKRRGDAEAEVQALVIEHAKALWEFRVEKEKAGKAAVQEEMKRRGFSGSQMQQFEDHMEISIDDASWAMWQTFTSHPPSPDLSSAVLDDPTIPPATNESQTEDIETNKTSRVSPKGSVSTRPDCLLNAGETIQIAGGTFTSAGTVTNITYSVMVPSRHYSRSKSFSSWLRRMCTP